MQSLNFDTWKLSDIDIYIVLRVIIASLSLFGIHCLYTKSQQQITNKNNSIEFDIENEEEIEPLKQTTNDNNSIENDIEKESESKSKSHFTDLIILILWIIASLSLYPIAPYIIITINASLMTWVIHNNYGLYQFAYDLLRITCQILQFVESYASAIAMFTYNYLIIPIWVCIKPLFVKMYDVVCDVATYIMRQVKLITIKVAQVLTALMSSLILYLRNFIYAVSRFFYKYILLPIGNTIIKLFEYVKLFIILVCEFIKIYILLPISNTIIKLLKWCASLINSLILHLRNFIYAASQFFYKYILLPIWNTIIKLFEYIQCFIIFVAKSISNAIVTVCELIKIYILLPIWNTIIKLFEYIRNAIAAVCEVIKTYILLPIWNVIVKLLKYIRNVMISVAKLICACFEHMRKFIVFIAQSIGIAIWNWILYPIYSYIIQPIITLLVTIFKFCKSIIYLFVSCIAAIFGTLCKCLVVIWKQIMLPITRLANIVIRITYGIGTLFHSVFVAVWHVFHQVVNIVMSILVGIGAVIKAIINPIRRIAMMFISIAKAISQILTFNR